jgi:L-asparaginase/Glu-tRNA(Gln) amidotransferase subunit D
MDDLDREIEEAVRIARRRVWQGRLATTASTAALLVIGIGGTIAMYQLFPDGEERELTAVRRENAVQNGEDPSAAAIAESVASELSADRRDQSRQRWRIMPGFALGFGAAYLIRKHLQPK